MINKVALITGITGQDGSYLKLVAKDQYLKDGGYTIMNYYE